MPEANQNETSIVTLNLGRKLQKPGKFTIPKRKQFLEHYSKTGNFSQSAIQVKMSRQSIIEYMQRDEQFKKAFQEIEDHFTDNIEQVSLSMSLQASRDGFQDRRMQLQARRPEKYNPKTEIDVKHEITLKNAEHIAGQILSENSINSAIKADYEIIEDS